MDRRAFLKLLGFGAATTAAGVLVPEMLEPERRIWQVSRHAPVGPSCWYARTEAVEAPWSDAHRAVIADINAAVEQLARHDSRLGELMDSAGVPRWTAGESLNVGDLVALPLPNGIVYRATTMRAPTDEERRRFEDAVSVTFIGKVRI